jgi:intein/homing endonuclease
LHENGLTKEDVFNEVNRKWGSLTTTKLEWNSDLQKDIIHIFNNDKCTDEDVKSFFVKNDKEHEVPFLALGEVTTWKEEAIKDIGGEDAFNQEYGLRFINASKSLLNEAIIDDLLKNKRNYEWEEISEIESKLKFSYKDLKWVVDDDLFIPIRRKEYKIVISVDISEGLGQDYSVINIFKVNHKSKELIDIQKASYKSITDFFRLDQIGIYRSNFVSVKQLAEILYLISFEYFNPDNVKIVLELNNYGNTLLAEMPHVFDGNNNYGSSIFVRYKHRADSNEEKIGLKIGENKNLLVKDYQDLMTSKSFFINNETTINEITTFVKHITAAGNTRYAADVGHDDCLLPDTLIKTINGYKKIKDIKLGDFVLTHLGNWKKVTNICIKDFSGDMYKVKFKGQPSLDITYNHPIYIASENYSRKNQKPGNYNKYEKRSWVLPGDIKKKHRCVNIIEKVENQKEHEIHWYEIFKKHKNFSEKNIKVKSIKFDKDFSKFVGLFLADGNCYKSNKTSYRVSIAFNRNQVDLINEIDSYLKRYGIRSMCVKHNKNGLSLVFNNKTFFELLSHCYNKEKEKVLPTWYNKLDIECVLDYWLKGDGCLSKKEGRRECLIGTSTSLQLALSMRDIALSLGRHALINKYKRHRFGVVNKDQYWVTIYKERPKSSSLKKISNFETSSVIDNYEKYKYEGLTYNLEVEDDNSYIANGIVVHNCVMTIVNSTSIFPKNEFKEICEEWMSKFMDKDISNYINECLKQVEYIEGLDYSQVLRVRRQYLNRNKGGGYNNGDWFGIN